MPRLAAIMVFLALLPWVVGGAMTAEPIMPIISVQLPIFFPTMFSASFSLHRLMVSRMTALNDLERSESLSRTILEASPGYTLMLDTTDKIIFCNESSSVNIGHSTSVGRHWLPLLPDTDHNVAILAIENAKADLYVNMLTHYFDANGQKRWADVIIKQIRDGSGWLIMVARAMAGALLIIDVDNFKSINDTFCHDAGDAGLPQFGVSRISIVIIIVVVMLPAAFMVTIPAPIIITGVFIIVVII